MYEIMIIYSNIFNSTLSSKLIDQTRIYPDYNSKRAVTKTDLLHTPLSKLQHKEIVILLFPTSKTKNHVP